MNRRTEKRCRRAQTNTKPGEGFFKSSVQKCLKGKNQFLKAKQVRVEDFTRQKVRII